MERSRATWNPITGCTPVSPGCRRCYAARLAKRLAGCSGYPRESPFAVTFHPERLEQPNHWRKPRYIFVCSMGDIFHADVPPERRGQIFEVMAEVRRHIFIVLTRRPQALARWATSQKPSFLSRLLDQVWMGVSVEDQVRTEERVPLLLRSWPGLCLVCCKPLLGPVDLSHWLARPGSPGVQWVMAGGETGPGAQPAELSDLRSLRNQCQACGTPFYLKQIGGPDQKRTGRILDGRTWEQMPPDHARPHL